MTEPNHAVFLSYASEDAAAAARICAALRAAGVEVWFDQSELRGGDAWDATIRAQIKACALFVPLISRHSRARVEGYFRLEWKLAVDRSHLMAAEKAFLVPLVIDDTDAADARVPERFREVQWTHLPDGATPAAFVARIERLLSAPPDAPAAAPRATAASAPAAPDVPTTRLAPAPRRRLAPLLVVTGVLLVTAIGYLFASRFLPGRPAASSAAVPAAPEAALPPISDKSIAVLPFTDMSEKKDQEYFSDGLSEELIDLLAKIPDLKVTARTSSFSFRGRPVTVAEIGQALRVANILEGSVRKAGNTLRVTAQLVRADNGYHLWSETYDRDLKDVFKVQDDIARIVVDKLQLTLAGGVPAAPARTEDPAAHNLYLEGRFQLQSDTNRDTAEALATFQKVVAADPGYAAAWTGIAWAEFRRGANGYVADGPAFARAEAAARHAMAVDPTFAGAYGLYGAILMTRLDWSGAKAAIDRALGLDPGDWWALTARSVLACTIGTPADAIATFRVALDRDPLNPLTRRYAVRMYTHAGHLDTAEAMIRQLLATHPGYSGAHYELGHVLLARGRPAEAASEFEAETNPTWRVNGLPIGYHAIGRTQDAEAAMKALLKRADGAEFQVAEAYGAFGDADRAFEWLNRAVTAKDPGIEWLCGDPYFIRVTGDPRYAALLSRLKIPAGSCRRWPDRAS